MKRHQSTGRLVGVSDVARRLGVTRHTAWQWTQHPDCPAAYDVTCGAAVWLADDIEPWLRLRAARRTSRRLGSPLSPTTIGVLTLLHARAGPVTAPEVFTALPGKARGTVYMVLSRLTRRGHVRRTCVEGNRRCALYAITAEGVVELERERGQRKDGAATPR